jgi:hypothetical protein
MAYDMQNQDDLIKIDAQMDDAIHAMVQESGNDWSSHMENVLLLLNRRIELTRPEVFSRIETLLKSEV